MDWFSRAKEAVEIVKNSDKIVLVFHNDADGLASGAIAKKALEKLGKEPILYCIEKMYPEVIEKIHSTNATFIYLDIGSGEVDLLERFENKIIIIDHHKTRESDKLVNLDPEIFGMSGDKDACSATLAFFFFSQLVPIDELVDLAIVGMQEIPGEPRGMNAKIMEDFKLDPKGKLARFGKIPRSVAFDLTVLGSVGYYSGGVSLALELALNGYSKEIKARIKELEEKRKAVVRELVTSVKLKETKHLQWFDAGSAFKGMGTKTIGSFCSYLVHRRIAPKKILLGFMDVEKKIPKLNGMELELSRDYAKVSARVPEEAKRLIEKGELPSLGLLMSKSCGRLGGFGDGHDFAASGIIPKDTKERLINEMEREISGERGLGNWIS